jgi:uncharacterized membrane protein
VTQQLWWTWAGNGLIVWAALVGTASVVVHSRVAWARTAMGRHLMAYMAVMAAVSCIRMVLGDAWWFALLRLIVFIGVPVVMTQRLWLQIKARRVEVDQAPPIERRLP